MEIWFVRVRVEVGELVKWLIDDKIYNYDDDGGNEECVWIWDIRVELIGYGDWRDMRGVIRKDNWVV